MNPLAVLGVLLAISLAGNGFLFHLRDNALESATRAEEEKVNAQEVANQCSLSVTKLSDDARAAAEEHKEAIKLAREGAKTHGATGTQILTTAPSSTDGCKAMVDLATTWHSSRKLK